MKVTGGQKSGNLGRGLLKEMCKTPKESYVKKWGSNRDGRE